MKDKSFFCSKYAVGLHWIYIISECWCDQEFVFFAAFFTLSVSLVWAGRNTPFNSGSCGQWHRRQPDDGWCWVLRNPSFLPVRTTSTEKHNRVELLFEWMRIRNYPYTLCKGNGKLSGYSPFPISFESLFFFFWIFVFFSDRLMVSMATSYRFFRAAVKMSVSFWAITEALTFLELSKVSVPDVYGALLVSDQEYKTV